MDGFDFKDISATMALSGAMIGGFLPITANMSQFPIPAFESGCSV